MKNNIFSLPKSILYFLLLSNFVLAIWLYIQFGSPWGWVLSDLAAFEGIKAIDALAISQFVLFAFTLDMLMRHSIKAINKRRSVNKIPLIIVQALSIFCYGLIALIAFVAIYDHSFSLILTASGAIGFAVAYIFRETIADVVASVQIQTDGVASIGDRLQITKDGKPSYYEVVQLDRRMVSIKNVLEYVIRIPNRKFIDIEFINLSRQPIDIGSRRVIELELNSQNDPNQVIYLLEQALQYVIHSNEQFIDFYRVFLTNIREGSFLYTAVYSCDSQVKPYHSDSIVYMAIVRFLKLGGMNLNADIQVTYPPENTDPVPTLLKDMKHLGIFKLLKHPEINRLSESATMIHCHAGEYLIQIGVEADSMYFIAEGILEVTIPNENGKQIKVATLWPGEYVGEMSLLLGEPRSANVQAKTNAILLEVKKADIMPIFEANPPLIENISRLLVQKRAANQDYLEGLDEVAVKTDANNLTKRILKFFFGSEQ